MGLFSHPQVNASIDSLFSKAVAPKARSDAAVGPATAVEPESASPEPRAAPASPQRDGARTEPELALEDQYFLRLAREPKRGRGDRASEPEPAAPTEPAGAEPEMRDAGDADAGDADAAEAERAQDDAEPGTLEELGEADAAGADTTLFVKNVPNVVITDRKARSALEKAFGPGIRSLRFRSIALSEAIPRKAAYITKKVHEQRNTVNAYIVYKTKEQFFEKLNTMNLHEFRGHRLFVDSALKPRRMQSKLCVFVGNLPFDTTEQQLYDAFADCGEISSVRVVRDRKYNIGKGFAYVQFADASSVQVALARNGQPLADRALRVTPCQSLQTQKARQRAGPLAQKKTPRSKQGRPARAGGVAKRRQDAAQPAVFEGERAKERKVSLGKKRRSATGRNATGRNASRK